MLVQAKVYLTLRIIKRRNIRLFLTEHHRAMETVETNHHFGMVNGPRLTENSKSLK